MTHTIFFWRPGWSAPLLLGLAAPALALLIAGVQPRVSSDAASATAAVSDELSRAVAAAGQPPAVGETAGVGIPLHAHAGVAVWAGAGRRLTIGLPATGTGRTVAGTTLYAGRGPAYRVAAQPTASGVRMLVHLSGAAAPRRYRFSVTGAAQLRHRADGGVALLSGSGREIGVVAAPWARDATGRAVPTHYEVEGTTLVQVVDHVGRDVTYPVVADPSIWTILKCAGSIVAAIVSVAVPVAKLVQLAKFVKAVGGVREAARLLTRATSKAEKLRAIRKAVGARSATAVAAALLGIPGIRDNCF